MRNGSFSMRRGTALRLDRLCVLAAAAMIAAACGPDDTTPPGGMGGTGAVAGSGGTAGSDGGTGGIGGDAGTGGTGGDLLEIKRVEVAPAAHEMIPGETLQLEATVFDFNDRVLEAPVQWISSAPEIASVDEDGLVTSVSKGEANIVATIQNIEGKAKITVLQTPVDSVTIVAEKGDTRALRVGETLKLRAVVRDVDGNEMEGLTVQWRTSDAVMATVDKQGLMTARGPGNGLNIDAHVGGVKGSARFNVTIRFGQVETGLTHTCGLTTETGLAYCWGDKASFFGLADSYVPRAVPGAPPLARIFVGTTHDCGLTAEGAAWCWGRNTSGRLGNKTGKDPEAAVEVFGGHVFTDLALGAFHTCGIAERGDVLCWGDNERGQLAKLRNDYGGVNEPIVSVTGPFEKLAAGHYYTCGLKEDASLWCWGTLAEGLTFPPATVATATPVRIGGSSATWDDVSAGSDFACVQRLETRTVPVEGGEPEVVEEMVSQCWGVSGFSRLGDGSPPLGKGGQAAPVKVLAPEPLVTLAAGSTHACGLDAEGVAYCWGANWGDFGKTGQLGIGADDAEYKAVPTTVETTTRFSRISTSNHTCAIALDGITWCWGPNTNFQIGVQRGEPPMSPRPTRVFGQ